MFCFNSHFQEFRQKFSMLCYNFKDISYNKKKRKKFKVDPKLSKAVNSCVKTEIDVIIQPVMV